MEQREETYRHRLYRPLQDEMKKKILFIMLNPSTATETETGPKSRTDKTIENIRNGKTTTSGKTTAEDFM